MRPPTTWSRVRKHFPLANHPIFSSVFFFNPSYFFLIFDIKGLTSKRTNERKKVRDFFFYIIRAPEASTKLCVSDRFQHWSFLSSAMQSNFKKKFARANWFSTCMHGVLLCSCFCTVDSTLHPLTPFQLNGKTFDK